VTVKLGLVKLLHKQFDLCEEACVILSLNHAAMFRNKIFSRKAKLEVQCPVQPGAYNVSQTVALPKQIPKGVYVCSYLWLLPG
jgi:hypothetical protein